MEIKLFCIVPIIMSIAFSCNAQNLSENNRKEDLARYIILEQRGQPTRFSSMLVKDMDLWLEQRFITRDEAFRSYRHKISSGSALLVKLMPNVKIYTLHEIFKHYNVSPKYQSLPIVVDDIFIKYPKSVIVVESPIVSINPVANWKSVGDVLYIRTVNPILNGAVR